MRRNREKSRPDPFRVTQMSFTDLFAVMNQAYKTFNEVGHFQHGNARTRNRSYMKREEWRHLPC